MPEEFKTELDTAEASLTAAGAADAVLLQFRGELAAAQAAVDQAANDQLVKHQQSSADAIVLVDAIKKHFGLV